VYVDMPKLPSHLWVFSEDRQVAFFQPPLQIVITSLTIPKSNISKPLLETPRELVPVQSESSESLKAASTGSKGGSCWNLGILSSNVLELL